MPQRDAHLLQRSHHGGGSRGVLPTVTEHPPRRCSEQLLLFDMLLVSFP